MTQKTTQNSKSSKTMIVTAGLPYSNGPIHLGHLVEYIQADIWSRFQKMKGHECLYICGNDAHGTPIMLKARDENITAEELIAKYHKEHHQDFKDFEVHFDNFYTTHSPENQKLLNTIYSRLKEKNLIYHKNIEQFYCSHDKMFLPDRFVKGICPHCKAVDQYGDSCEACGSSYSSLDVQKPYCVLCKNTPEIRNSDHLFFKLSEYKDFLTKWVPQHTQPEVSNKLKEWLQTDLKDWNISRDKPYFGFEIPEENDKYFYVWLDAPVGYMASLENWCQKNNKNFQDYWSEKTQIYHFIGVDIVYFHLLFWPSILKASHFQTPTQVFVHGFMNMNKEKMSKSRKNFITAKEFFKNINPLFLRYYYASKLNSSSERLDFNSEDFILKINSELIGKITNLASRSAQMLNKKLDSKLSPQISEKGKNLLKKCYDSIEFLEAHYEKREYSKVIQKIRFLAEEANRYFDQEKPWILMKTEPERARQVITDILNTFRFLAIALKPVLPSYTKNVEKLFQEQDYSWSNLSRPLESPSIKPFQHLVSPLEQKQINALFL